MKVLVTGARGMLARATVPHLLRAGHRVFATDLRLPADEPGAARTARPVHGRPAAAPHFATLDVTDGDAFRALACRLRPDWILHLAAFTQVDACEADPAPAMAANADGAAHAGEAAAASGARVLLVSTDYVFDGTRTTPYTETDAPAPRSVYGRSKWLGEQRLAAACPRHVIARTAWLYGAGGRNFVDTIRAKAAAGEALRVVDDQRGCPTWTAHMAPALAWLMAGECLGTYHVTNAGACTWWELAVATCETAGIEANIERATTAEMGRPAPRPACAVLDGRRFFHATGRRLPHWRTALRRYLRGEAPLHGQGGRG